MPRRNLREKKGLTRLSDEDFVAQASTYDALVKLKTDYEKENKAVIQAPVPFDIIRKPVLQTFSSDNRETEVFDPSVKIYQTRPVELKRSENPITFDVITLSRDVTEEDGAILGMGLTDAQGPDEEESDEEDFYEP